MNKKCYICEIKKFKFRDRIKVQISQLTANISNENAIPQQSFSLQQHFRYFQVD